MKSINSLKELVDIANQKNLQISDIVLEHQANELEKTKQELIDDMEKILAVMEESIQKGLQQNLKSNSGLVGGGAFKLKTANETGELLNCGILNTAMAYAVAIAEYNACMGKIVASPTAGSCGILPSVILSIGEHYTLDRGKIIMSLFTASGVGMVIANRANLSGAEGGCQAECGSASAMAAAAAVELMGGTPVMVSDAVAIALKCIMGLVCDPVAGLVECPCVKRNASGAGNAITATNMALAGMNSIIPADEVIDAMKSVGDLMSPMLRETSLGGIACSKTAKEIEKTVFKILGCV
jgi:L-serine dehydratase